MKSTLHNLVGSKQAHLVLGNEDSVPRSDQLNAILSPLSLQSGAVSRDAQENGVQNSIDSPNISYHLLLEILVSSLRITLR